MDILFLRHGITEWNLRKILQGQTDLPLAVEGKQQVTGWSVPENSVDWYVSPLLRARQTADLLGLSGYTICPDLIEMNWGEWEGCSLAQLRTLNPDLMEQNEARGLDLQPPGGETPRQVRVRIQQWLETLTDESTADHCYSGVITHKGVIRAAISLAMDWEMKSDSEIKLRANTGYKFKWQSGNLEFIDKVELIA